MRFLFLLFSLSLFASTHTNDIPYRLQWRNNLGYCGETSLINAALFYGQYISQYDVRALVTKDHRQNDGELLLGANDTHAARKLHLQFEEWDNSTEQNTDQFLIWVKQFIVQGYPVAIGIYANQYLFYRNHDPYAGDPDYDHIVTAFAITSSNPNDPTYNGTDQLAFSDHGLWHNQNTPVYYFNYAFDPFQGDRLQANSPNGPIYTLPNHNSNYGIAITGIIDPKHETFPIRVTTDYNYEDPPILDHSNIRPEPMPLTLTITISNLKPHFTYVLYRYNTLESVPDSDFNAHASQAYQTWTFTPTSSTWTQTEQILSNEMAIYRCVFQQLSTTII